MSRNPQIYRPGLPARESVRRRKCKTEEVQDGGSVGVLEAQVPSERWEFLLTFVKRGQVPRSGKILEVWQDDGWVCERRRTLAAGRTWLTRPTTPPFPPFNFIKGNFPPAPPCPGAIISSSAHLLNPSNSPKPPSNSLEFPSNSPPNSPSSTHKMLSPGGSGEDVHSCIWARLAMLS